MPKIMVFTRFERFAHWCQAILILCLMLTGFEVYGLYDYFGYEESAELHRDFAWALIYLWIFIIFWNLVTGEWRQYIPTTDKLFAVMRYYTVGIFNPDLHHPYKKTRKAKHNPLQRLAYLSFNIGISPVIWVSGLLYMYYNEWEVLGIGDWGLSLYGVALVHVAAAFAMVAFFVGHVYMAFTGKPPWEYFVAMITGYEAIEEE